jgi:hypothetical protein
MNVRILVSLGKVPDVAVCEAFAEGVRKAGDKAECVAKSKDATVAEGVDVSVMVGVKSRYPVFNSYMEAGRTSIIIDKGFIRGRDYWRVSINALQPLEYFQREPRPGDRLQRLGVKIAGWRRNPHGSVVFCCGTEKYNNWHNLPHPQEHARQVLDALRKRTDRRLVFRPKPGRKAEPIPGYGYSQEEELASLWRRTHCLVTYGSNAAVEGILAGIPAIVIGDGIARPVSSTSLADVERPRCASRDELWQWACDWSYCQWSSREMRSGEAWRHLRPIVESRPPIRLGGISIPLEA